ncbi:hypothetical protein FV232_12545 [Methylobacterium sp. WL30]|jgi:hypothetical protein|uniref:hypothetical protein n=1 Tax=unclassified Methylobacterium TaxID=2615210 RepID=UPI0011C7E1E1|nr:MULTISPECIES: hypothetical protein [unclassified Methylobacterium]MCJ2010583.1 hypothetical protein [Methylobacterium sp. J-092]MCJ2041054.1 hypothetical protein [Methylobacterium sp. J-059]MCJ2111610.1 hypothetical protein [Methylobacterium sp. E-025]TXM94054.1 hypothetical protein FV223_06050 [Methylobacterium sp. WL116]TXN39314.1 hypothetical protein FV225_10315 [Methylobacterium sp. WL93]
MRGFLTSGVKAILAIAALSTAAHWALRVQRDPAPSTQVLASLPDPVTTGSIEPRKPERVAAQPAQKAAADLDQDHLSALIASTTGLKPKAQKAVVAKR